MSFDRFQCVNAGKPAFIAVLIVFAGQLFSHASFAGGKELRIKVTNPSAFARSNETISLSWKSLTAKFPTLNKEMFVVIDVENGAELLSQFFEDQVLFQSSFKANEVRSFVLKNGQAIKRQNLVDGRFVEPRQDYAWENDRIAFRMYGPALAKDVKNGIDVWTKRVRYLIVEKWYKGEEDTGSAKISYHVDHGEGADFFSVGKTLGAGGCGIWYNGRVYQPGVFSSYRTIANGPIRLVFELTYDSLLVEGRNYPMALRITLDAGQNMNKVEVTHTDSKPSDAVEFVCGLVKRKDVSLIKNESNGWIGLWGLTNADSVNGSLGTGVVLSGSTSKSILEDKDQYLIGGKATTGKPFRYYAGAGWTRSGDFSNEQEWRDYLNTFARSLQSPLKVRISK